MPINWRRIGLTVSQAGREGAAACCAYGIAVASLLIVRPWLAGGASALPFNSWNLLPGATVTFVVLLLVLYSLVGAALGAIVACALSGTARGRRALATAHAATLWSSVGSLSCILLLMSHALVRRHAFVLAAILVPLGLTVTRLASAWRPAWRQKVARVTNSAVVSILLVGQAYLLAPRPAFSLWVRAPLALVLVCVLVTVALLSGRLTARWPWRPGSATRGLVLAAAGLSLAAGSAVFSLAVSGWRVLEADGDAGATAPRSDRPNVILIALDTVRADHLSLYGYKRDTTPGLRRWSAAGFTLYRTAISASNHTLPSHASIFTGWSPHRHGALVADDSPLGRGIAPEAATLPAILASHGYTTVGIVANTLFVRPDLGFARGFSRFESERRQQTLPAMPPYFAAETLRRALLTVLPSADAEQAYSDADAVTERAIGFLDGARNSETPFFLFLNYMDAHVPYVPPAPFDSLYGGVDQSFRWFAYPELVEGVVFGHTRSLDAATREHLAGRYDGAITYLDRAVDRLFQRLQQLGLYDNTLIILTSDHGEALGERSLLGHGLSLYQKEVHVPLMVKYPGATAAAEVETPVSGVDLLPTVLDVVGAPAPSALEGRSLRLTGRGEPRWIAAESSRLLIGADGARPAAAAEVALVHGPLKLIVRTAGGYELYDLSTDPLEQRNVYGRTALPGGWQEAASRAVSARRGPAPAVTDPGLLERLRSLGYVR